jgi:Uma2 family endonuclease
MATAALTRYTPEEYLALERRAAFKSEFIDGRIVAMTGAQRPHIVIVHNLDREIGARLLDGPCEVYPTEMKVRIDASGRYVYPDLCVSCDPRFEDGATDVLLNPVLIVEVLSESTEAYDRGEKFFHYRRIESLREYVLVSRKECRVERFTREGDFWRHTSVDDPDGSLRLDSLGVEVPLRLVYAKALRPGGLAGG